MRTGVQPRANGVLVVIKAKDCGACKSLEANGTFGRIDELVNLGTDGSVQTLALDHMAPAPGGDLFNMVREFPRFMYMFPATFDDAIDANVDVKSIISEVRFFNHTYDPVLHKMSRTSSFPITFDAIQAFCDRSMNDLLSTRMPTAPHDGLVARYQRTPYY